MSVPGPWRWLREPARLHTSPVARAGISRMAIASRIGDREQTPVSPPTTRQAIPGCRPRACVDILPLYGSKGLVIFDHPYNADFARLGAGWWRGRAVSDRPVLGVRRAPSTGLPGCAQVLLTRSR
jgi:hypothetical protein